MISTKIPDAHDVDTATQPYRIACIGGGTGLYTLLSGLKRSWPEADLSAVVAMTDSGGSTGRLRVEFGHLPPGDVRKCLVALSDAPAELSTLMEHRYKGGNDEGLKGHVVGNLLLTACKEIAGGEYEAIELMGRILDIKGKVYPITLDDTHLVAHLTDGTAIEGETRIDVPESYRAPIDRLTLTRPATIFPKTRDALLAADAIVIGPGDLYTSVLPNLIIGGMAETLREAAGRGTRIIYIVNTMTKHGETDEYRASDFIRRVQETIGDARLDTVLVNEGKISAKQRSAYLAESAHPVEIDIAEGASAYRVLRRDIVGKHAFARHDPDRLALAIRDAVRER